MNKSIMHILLFNIYTSTTPAVRWSYYSVTLWPHSMQHLKSKLALEDKGYESMVVRTSTYPLYSEGPPKIHHMFPVLRMPLLIQTQLHHASQEPDSHITDLYAMMFNLQFFWRWRHPQRWDSFVCQYSTIAEPCWYPTASILQVHLEHIC